MDRNYLRRSGRLAWLLGVVVLFSTTACNLSETTASTPSILLEGTVTAMQATLAAFEAQSSEPVDTPAPPSPQILVVTATPTETPPPSPTPVETATLPPIATDTATPAPQPKTVYVVVTPTPVPLPTTYTEAPVNIAPPEGAVVEQGFGTLLQWSWNGLLGPGEYFEVKIRPDQQPRSAYIAQELGEGHQFPANLGPGRYQWTVQIVQGHFINDSGHPDDWVFEGFRSPESTPSLLIIHHTEDDDDDHSPVSRSQADAPAPAMPYGLLLGGVAFVTWIGLNRRQSTKL